MQKASAMSYRGALKVILVLGFVAGTLDARVHFRACFRRANHMFCVGLPIALIRRYSK